MSKLVALSDDAYKTLAKRKRGKESFSQVVMRELGPRKKPDIMKFAGMFREDNEKWKEIEKQIYKERHAAKMRDVHEMH